MKRRLQMAAFFIEKTIGKPHPFLFSILSEKFLFLPRVGLVVQWIERKFPKLLIRVRFPARLLLLALLFINNTFLRFF